MNWNRTDLRSSRDINPSKCLSIAMNIRFRLAWFVRICLRNSTSISCRLIPASRDSSGRTSGAPLRLRLLSAYFFWNSCQVITAQTKHFVNNLRFSEFAFSHYPLFTPKCISVFEPHLKEAWSTFSILLAGTESLFSLGLFLSSTLIPSR